MASKGIYFNNANYAVMHTITKQTIFFCKKHVSGQCCHNPSDCCNAVPGALESGHLPPKVGQCLNLNAESYQKQVLIFFQFVFVRAEQEKKLAQQKKEEEERLRKEEADKKAKEAEEKRKRLEEAEKKRQAMMQAQKEKQQAAGQGAKGTVKKADSGVSTTILHRIAFVPMQIIEAVKGILCQKDPYSAQSGH